MREFFLHLASIRLRSSHSSVRYKHKALFESKLRDDAWSSMNRTPKKRFDEISVRSRLDALMVDFSLLISSFVSFDCQQQKCQSLLFLVVVLFGEGVEKLGRLGLALLCTIKLASGIEQLISLRCQSAECEVMDLVWLQFFVVGNALNQHYLWSVSMCRWKTHSPCSSRMWSKIIEQKKKSFVVLLENFLLSNFSFHV